MSAKFIVPFFILAVAAMINLAAADTPAAAADAPAASTAYSNHTVGGPAGWFFDDKTNQTSADYTAWAANQTFNLGDYLIFNTDSNSTVIQTYNTTTYKSCSTDDASDSDTFEYMGGNNDFGVGMVISVPLTIEGPQYYFSEANDGFQCQHSMAFEIKVGHGLGLPPSLNQPPPPPYVEPPSTVEEGQSPPITIVPTPPNIGMKIGDNHLHLVAMIAILVLFF